MRQFIYLLAKLYPGWWRDRYGAEFTALIEDDAATLKTAMNVLARALLMQIRTLTEGKPYLRGEMGIIGLLIRNWWLLALGGIVQAAISIVYFLMQSTHGLVSFHAWHAAVVNLGYLELTAGVFTIAAGLLKSKNGRCWLLVLNGLAVAGLGLIQAAFTRFRISFLTVVLLVILMAATVGLLQLGIARTLRRRQFIADVWLFTLAGTASIGFVLVFLALGLRWIPIAPGSHTDLLWLGCYFAFSAVFMLGSAMRMHLSGYLANRENPSGPHAK